MPQLDVSTPCHVYDDEEWVMVEGDSSSPVFTRTTQTFVEKLTPAHSTAQSAETDLKTPIKINAVSSKKISSPRFMSHQSSMKVSIDCPYWSVEKKHSVIVDVNATLFQVKHAIQTQMGIPVEQQKLMIQGYELNDQLMLADYCIMKDNIIDCKLALHT